MNAVVLLLDARRADSSSNTVKIIHLQEDQSYMIKKARKFYVGGALDMDMWAAEQVLHLLVVSTPFIDHDVKRDQRSKCRTDFILPTLQQKRNY